MTKLVPEVFRGYKAEDHDAYAEEAHKLQTVAHRAVETAERETEPRARRRAYDAAITAVGNAVAMHQRAANSAGAADDEDSFERHTFTWRTLNDLIRQLRSEQLKPPQAPRVSLTKRSARGFATTEAMVGGLLVVGGTVAAIRMDQAITARPLGVAPSVYAFGASVAVAVAARRYRRPRLSRAAASVAVGLAVGMVARRLAT